MLIQKEKTRCLGNIGTSKYVTCKRVMFVTPTSGLYRQKLHICILAIHIITAYFKITIGTYVLSNGSLRTIHKLQTK